MYNKGLISESSLSVNLTKWPEYSRFVRPIEVRVVRCGKVEGADGYQPLAQS